MVGLRAWVTWVALVGASIGGGSLATVLAQTSDGFDIVKDASLFSPRFRAEFEDMNATYGEYGFELEVLEGERPRLADVSATHGEAGEPEEVDVILGFGDREVRATLRFHYYGDVGFGVLPDDPDALVIRVKRRED